MVRTFYQIGHSSPATAEFPTESPPRPGGGDLRFLTANGSSDSHAVTLSQSGEANPSPRAGKPYRTISWGDIRRMIDRPSAVEKDDAPFVILSTYAECDGRTHAVQRERGWFGGLAVDIDKGSPTLEAVVAAVTAVTAGARFHVYSSSSASEETRKWRVLIPLASPLPGADYLDTQAAFFDLLGTHGIQCDPTLARAAQPVYLPNVPPKRRGADGLPVFYRSHHADGPTLELTDESAIVAARYARRQKEASDREAREARAAEYQKRREEYVRATGDDFNPVAHYNATHTIASRFTEYGFTKGPSKRGNHYRSPLSTSGSFSTQDLGTHWVTVSAWAKEHNVGKESKNGNRYGDAFDLFVHFEHGGDRRAAIQAYASENGRDIDAPRPVVVEKLADRGEARDLDDWRQDVAVERSLALRQPGIHLDRSPTGSGKTFATMQEVIRAIETTAAESEAGEDVRPIRRVLVVYPDHANAKEAEAAWRAKDQDAVAYPKLSEENCGNFEAASYAQSLGLVAGAAVCWNCNLNKTCQYQRQMAAARVAAVQLATHERLRLSEDQITKDVDVIAIEECLEDVLAPEITVRVDDLLPVVSLAQSVSHGLLFRDNRVIETTSEEKDFADAIVEAHRAIVRAAEAAQQAGATQIEMPTVQAYPEHWQTTVMKWADAVGVDVSDKRKKERFQKSMRLLTMIVTGRLHRLTLLVEQTSRHERQDDGTVREWNPLHHFVTGSWITKLPYVPVIGLDATANADDLRARIGSDVIDRTPTGHLPLRQKVAQVVMDVEKGDAPSSSARLVEAFMHIHPEVRRIGLIGHREHVIAMMSDDTVFPPSLRARISKHCYFGQGPDRASNSWQDECDHLLIVGTPRPGGTPVRGRLVVTGRHEAAARPSGGWGPRHWEGETLEGETITEEGKGYLDPEWHAAHAAIVRASLHQAVGRGRGVSGCGIPVTVFSDEPLGLPLDTRLEPVTPVVMQVVQAVRDVLGGESATEQNPIRKSYKEMFGSRPGVRVGAVIDRMVAVAVMHGEKLGKRAAEKRLRLAREHGRLEVPKKGWLLLPADQPSGPAPAMLAPMRPATIISATGPTEPVVVADVAAEAVPETTTSVTTSEAPATRPMTLDEIVMEIDERAAIMAEGCGIDDATADRLAHEAVMGKADSEPLHPPETIGVDTLSLAARLDPLVDHAVQKIGGSSVRVIREMDDPFSTGWRSQRKQARPGHCACGSDRSIDIPIHGGASVRRECGQCGKFVDFIVWHGVPDPKYAAISTRPPPAGTTPRETPAGNRLSFLTAPQQTTPMLSAG